MAKNLRPVTYLATLLTIAAPGIISADTLAIGLTVQPHVSGFAGSSIPVSGTIGNQSSIDFETSDLFLDFFGYNVEILTFNQTLGLDSLPLSAGTNSSTGLFAIDVSPTAAPGLYPYNFFLADVNDNEGPTIDGTVDVQLITAPEPGSLSLVLSVAAAACAFCLRRVRRKAMLLAALIATSAFAQSPRFATGTPDLTVGNNRLTIEIPIENRGDTAALDVRILSGTLGSVSSLSAEAPSLELGVLSAGAQATATLAFPAAGLNAGSNALLTIRGEYSFNGSAFGFTVNRFVQIPSSSGGGQPTVMSAADRFASMQAIEAKLASLPTNADGRAQQIVSFLLSRPEFQTADADETGNVWARWQDGAAFIVLTPEQELQSPGAPVVTPFHPSIPAPLLAVSHSADAAVPNVSTYSSMPASDEARLLFSLPAGWPDPTPVLANMLNSAGYHTTIQTATLDELKTQIHGDGLLYWDTHSGACGEELFCIATSEIATMANLSLPQNVSDILGLDAQGLAGPPRLALSVLGDGSPVVHYFITQNFIAKYWGNFSDNSLVVFDSCAAGLTSTPPAKTARAALLRDAVFTKNASVIAAWSDTIHANDAYRSMLIVADRLLGDNTLTGSDAENPKQRAFPWSQVLVDLGYHGAGSYTYTEDKRTFSSSLGFFTNPVQAGDGFGLLVPSIERARIDEPAQKIYLDGFFGEVNDGSGRPRQLTIAGRSISVTNWDAGEIEATLPPDVAGVTSVVVGPHQSNPAMITAWDSLRLDYRWFVDTLMEETILNVKLRTDLRAYRHFIHEVPRQPTGVLNPAPGSFVNYKAGGGENCSDQSGIAESYQVIATNFNLPALDYNQKSLSMALSGSLSSNTSAALLAGEAQVAGPTYPTYQIHEYFSIPNHPVDIIVPEQFRPMDDPLTNVSLLLDAAGSIVAGANKPLVQTGKNNVCLGYPSTRGTMDWSGASPRSGTAVDPNSSR